MDTVLRNMVYKQNKALLSMIAATYGKSEEEMQQRYLTPTFYLPIPDMSKIYPIRHEEK
jgi:hypothetical protein